MAKHMCTDHEELYKNLLKPQMKVGKELVSQVSTNSRVNTLMPDVQNTLYQLQNKAYQD